MFSILTCFQLWTLTLRSSSDYDVAVFENQVMNC